MYNTKCFVKTKQTLHQIIADHVDVISFSEVMRSRTVCSLWWLGSISYV